MGIRVSPLQALPQCRSWGETAHLGDFESQESGGLPLKRRLSFKRGSEGSRKRIKFDFSASSDCEKSSPSCSLVRIPKLECQDVFLDISSAGMRILLEPQILDERSQARNQNRQLVLYNEGPKDHFKYVRDRTAEHYEKMAQSSGMDLDMDTS